jgi:hypothetical protein
MLQQSMQALPKCSSRGCSSVSFLGTDIDSSVLGVLASLEFVSSFLSVPGLCHHLHRPADCVAQASHMFMYSESMNFPNREGGVSDDTVPSGLRQKPNSTKRRWNGQVTAHTTLLQGLSAERPPALRIVEMRVTTDRVRGNTGRASGTELHYDR